MVKTAMATPRFAGGTLHQDCLRDWINAPPAAPWITARDDQEAKTSGNTAQCRRDRKQSNAANEKSFTAENLA